jgi:hypothetical protein
MARKAKTNPAQLCGLESKKKSGHRRGFFLDIPLYRTNQELARNQGRNQAIAFCGP